MSLVAFGENARLAQAKVRHGATAANIRGAIWNLRDVSPIGRTAQGGRENQSAAATAQTAGDIAERPGEVYTREELRKRVWPITKKGFGDFDQAVNVAIAKLRSALESPTEPL
jgi:hypothetical protein